MKEAVIHSIGACDIAYRSVCDFITFDSEKKNDISKP